ncbi:extracellular solute-binding protein [Evansella vedderi]|nr:extracellular solute-binding protein [Evansella vedderi]
MNLFVTVFVLLSLVLVGCSDSTTGISEEDRESALENLNDEGFPIVNEKIEVEGFAAKFFAAQDWNNLMLWEEYEKKSNIKVNWETVTTEVLAERRNLKLASGDYPEIMFASALSRTDLAQYGNQGTFIALNELIDLYAPNFKKIMEEYPIVEKGITMPDGNIYGFPAIFDPDFKGLHIGTPWINKEWLENLELEEPKTLEELYEVLTAFKEQDPNGSGKDDVIPWGGVSINGVINYLRGAFELNNRGVANLHIDQDPQTGNVRFIPTTDNYKQLLEYVNKLYSEGLIDQEIFTIAYHEFTSKGTQGIYGVINGIDPGTLMNLEGYVGLPVLEGINGKRLNTAIGSPLGNIGMFVITDKAKNPEAMVRWIDYFYGDEGAKNFFLGFEGITYIETEDGVYEYTEEITNNPDGLNLDQAISQYLTWPGGFYPGIVKEQYFKGAEGNEASRARAEKAEPYTLDMNEVWPVFNFTLEEHEELTVIQNDINTYVEESTAEFVTGRRSFSDWDNYVNQLERMGLNRYLEIIQAAYERYLEE